MEGQTHRQEVKESVSQRDLRLPCRDLASYQRYTPTNGMWKYVLCNLSQSFLSLVHIKRIGKQRNFLDRLGVS